MPRQTKLGTRKLSDVAQHVVVPSGIVSTGYPSVQAKCRDLGIEHDDWQQGFCRLALGKRKSGKYAATVGGVVTSWPRQVGKTFTVGSVIFALCILFPGLLALWTAHRTRTANETFRSMKAMARRKKIAPHIAYVRSTNGEQEIGFRNGSRILFGAREQGFGRGFAEVDIEVFDEAQILTERALEDMIAATNQAKHPAGALLFYMGTPPRPIDAGDVFRNKRAKALSGASKDTVYVELSADADAKPDDRTQWAKANPSYPLRTPTDSMLRLRENIGSDESFLREGLGIWDEVDGDDSDFDLSNWPHLIDMETKPGAAAAFGLAVSFDQKWASIGVAAPAGDRRYLELVEHRPGMAWALERAIELHTEHGAPFVVDPKGPAAPLIPDLKAAGVPVIETSTDDVANSTAGFVNGVESSLFLHRGTALITDAIKVLRKRTIGDGRVALGRKASSADISPVEAIVLAAWGATNQAPPEVWSIAEEVERLRKQRADQPVEPGEAPAPKSGPVVVFHPM